MTQEMIISNINSILAGRKESQRANAAIETLPITFTHEKKEAVGCAILLVQADGSYEVQKFESKFADVKDQIADYYHATVFDCDDDLEVMDGLLEALA